MEFPIYSYPTNAKTDPRVLYDTLGSFWTQVFQEKGTLKGYTLGMAEDLIQKYYDLLEIINSFSAKDVDVFHKEKWYPILIQRSKYNQIPFIFEKDSAVLGEQPNSDIYYGGETFKLGFPKTLSRDIYGYRLDKEFITCGTIADRVLAPQVLLVNNVDFEIKNEVIYFNQDIFNNSNIPKVDLMDEAGNLLTYTDRNNIVRTDQVITLWAFHASINQETLFKSFGILLDLQLTNNEFYKTILVGLLSMYRDGPTIRALREVCCSLSGVSPVLSDNEVIEDVFEELDANGALLFKHVITDKHAYKFDPYYNFLKDIEPGVVVNTGDLLVDAFEYFDAVQQPKWWRSKLFPKISYSNTNIPQANSGVHFPSYIFLGNYEGQLFFKNEIDLLTYDFTGKLTFPSIGSPADNAEFNNNLNTRKIDDVFVKDTIVQKLNLSLGDTYPIEPLDFLFENFIKNNTAIIKLNFKDVDSLTLFMSIFPKLKTILPKHVYFLVYFDMLLPKEEYENLNACFNVPYGVDEEREVNADGSDSTDLGTAGVIYEDGSTGKHNNDIATRLFTCAKGINLITGAGIEDGTPQMLRVTSYLIGVNDLNYLHYEHGTLLEWIPDGATTREVSHIKLLNFCDPIIPVTTTAPTTTTTSTSTTTTSTSTTGGTTTTSTSSTSTTTEAGVDLTNGLQLFLPMNETSGNRMDCSSNAFAFTPYNGVSHGTGIEGNGARFTRDNLTYLARADHAALRFGTDFTLSLWIKFDATPQFTIIFNKYGGGSLGTEFALRYTTSPASRFDAWVTSNGFSATMVSVQVPVAQGEFHHIVVYRQGITLGMVVDNVNTITTTATGYNYISSGAGLEIGGILGGQQGMNGIIDAVGKWNRKLTSGEIAALYNAGSGYEPC